MATDHKERLLKCYWQRRARGACVRCGQNTGHGGSRCLPCNEKHRAFQRRRRPPMAHAALVAKNRRASLTRWYGAEEAARCLTALEAAS